MHTSRRGRGEGKGCHGARASHMRARSQNRWCRTFIRMFVDGDGGGVHVACSSTLAARRVARRRVLRGEGGRRATSSGTSRHAFMAFMARIRIPDSHQAPTHGHAGHGAVHVIDASSNAPCASWALLRVVRLSIRVVSVSMTCICTKLQASHSSLHLFRRLRAGQQVRGGRSEVALSNLSLIAPNSNAYCGIDAHGRADEPYRSYQCFWYCNDVNPYRTCQSMLGA
ncbi:hypothetical protein C8Q74DRAFT_105841 [Fomes fomentarius]|nr:hypothetical protein C8Q74DRAFT_105841 [Fomes fomentarius]